MRNRPAANHHGFKSLLDVVANAGVSFINDLSMYLSNRSRMYQHGGLHVVHDNEISSAPGSYCIGLDAQPPYDYIPPAPNKNSSIPEPVKHKLAPGGTLEYTARAQVEFRPEALHVMCSDPEQDRILNMHVQVSDIKVGKNSQHIAAGPIPVSTYNTMFKSGQKFKTDLAEVSVTLNVRLTSNASVPLDIMVTMIGSAV